MEVVRLGSKCCQIGMITAYVRLSSIMQGPLPFNKLGWNLLHCIYDRGDIREAEEFQNISSGF
jgi:hypothetical protein